ncbi:MAG: nitroreductase family protein, partial [candidate division KSB1 bacterium]|nr:nitroreductase family protein [candidate division KSB1 bacterium]
MFTSFIDILNKRKASRAIAITALSDEIIHKLMAAAQLSASCFNNQPWRFLFLTEPEALEKGRKALSGGNSWAKTAPLLIVGFSKPDLDCQMKDGRKYYLFDLG